MLILYLCGMDISETNIELFQEVVRLLNEAFPLYIDDEMHWWASLNINNEPEGKYCHQFVIKVELDFNAKTLWFTNGDDPELFIQKVKDYIAYWKEYD